MSIVVINRVIPGCFEVTTDSRSKGTMDGEELIKFLRDELDLDVNELKIDETIEEIADKIDDGFTRLKDTMMKEVIDMIRKMIEASEEKVGA